jgi:hypothetical protein
MLKPKISSFLDDELGRLKVLELEGRLDRGEALELEWRLRGGRTEVRRQPHAPVVDSRLLRHRSSLAVSGRRGRGHASHDLGMAAGVREKCGWVTGVSGARVFFLYIGCSI